MPLNVPDGAACFIDSTILYYSLISAPGLSEPCSDLLDRIVAGKVNAACTVQVFADVVHKVMMFEAVVKTGRARAGMVG
jgi:predicted nucleic acid-binding protein